MISVILFEDDDMVRTSMTRYFNYSQNIKLIKTFKHAKNIVEDWRNYPADVVLLDINMPKVNGIQGLELLVNADPMVKVLMLTSHDTDEYIFQACKIGARGYVLKGGEPEDLEKAIAVVAKGESIMSPSVARKVMRSFQKVKEDPAPAQVHLTKRETEVLGLVVAGKSRKMIADELNLSPHTINEYFTNIYKKLQINSAQEAVREALRRRLLPGDQLPGEA